MQVRERVSRLDVGASRAKTLPFGLSSIEIVVAFVAVAFLVVVLTWYWTALRPEQERLRQLEQQLADQERVLGPITLGGAAPTASPNDVARDALETLERFKTGYLRALRSGEIDLLRDLNAMAKKNSVQLTSGIDTTPKMPGQSEEDTSGAKKAPKIRKQAELLNAFPALATRFSVAGEYANLRGFISELESSKQFLVVKTISIVSQEGKTTGRGRRDLPGGLVLSIEMTAYFRPQ